MPLFEPPHAVIVRSVYPTTPGVAQPFGPILMPEINLFLERQASL